LYEIFQWEIDFYALQKNDYFKVIFDEELISKKSVGIPKIYAAMFHHKGKDYYGFYFEQSGDGDYFDEEGNSVKKQFLKVPLKFTRISSGFSRRRLHPILKRYRPHLGIDFAAPTGTPVHSVGDGVVIIVGYQKRGAGRFVKIRHGRKYKSGYLHLSRFARGIRKGVRVKQGQIIGYVGSTGLATGPHLDFRFWENGVNINYLAKKFRPSIL